MTKYANKILNLINESTAHMTAEQIFFELKNTEPGIVLATVYNNLNALSAKNMIRKISLEGQPDRYDKLDKHDHLICKTCGRLLDFSFSDLTESLKVQLDTEIFKYDLKVYFECPECRSNARRAH